MSILESPWQSIFLDFITNLPKSKAYDSILVVVCYLSKMAHFTPTQTVADAVKVAELFIENIFMLHRLPKIIISDRDPKFSSKFWKTLFKTQKTSCDSAQLFIQRRMQKQNAWTRLLRLCWRTTLKIIWMLHVPILEFAYNSARYSANGTSPFSLISGINPDSPISFALRSAESQEAACPLNRHNKPSFWMNTGSLVISTLETLSFFDETQWERIPSLNPVGLDPKSKHSPVSYRLKLPPGTRMHQAVYVGWLRP